MKRILRFVIVVILVGGTVSLADPLPQKSPDHAEENSGGAHSPAAVDP